MEFISEDYRELNKKLHEGQESYGQSSWRWADMVSSLMEETGSKTVLDYGCGKGILGYILGNPEWLREYDPAIPGKDVTPTTVSDLVVCTDVLEHIEPDYLDKVIDHIHALSRTAVLLVISVVPAEKTLADGRNAHLSLHDAKWWKEKLEKKFLIQTWNDRGNEIVVIGSSIRVIGEMINKSAVSDEIRSEQAFLNCAKTKERVKEVPAHDKRCVIVCYGPSLLQTWTNIAVERKLYGATIVSVSGAHDFLIERGIIPDIHSECDPREHKAFFTRNPHPDVNYWIGSCCHTKLIDQLLPHKLSLWHVYNSEEDMKIIAPDGPDPDNWILMGGSSIGARAVNLMFQAGYRSFSIYGMDCSFGDKGEQHAGQHSGKIQNEWPIRVGDRWFKSSGNMMYIAKSFMYNMRTLKKVADRNNDPFIAGTTDRVELFIHGDGMLQEMYRYNSVAENYAA